MLLGSDVTLRDGRQAKFKLTLDKASQTESHRKLEMSTDAGNSWVTVFDYTYVKATRLR